MGPDRQKKENKKLVMLSVLVSICLSKIKKGLIIRAPQGQEMSNEIRVDVDQQCASFQNNRFSMHAASVALHTCPSPSINL